MLTRVRVAAYDESVSPGLFTHPLPRVDDFVPSSSSSRDEGDALRRFRQLRHAEERLRPLRETRLAHVYWRVRDELDRLVHEVLLELSGRGRKPLQ